MAKAVPSDIPESVPPFGSDLYFIAIPNETYRELSRVATERSMTLAQVIGTAFGDFLKVHGR